MAIRGYREKIPEDIALEFANTFNRGEICDAAIQLMKVSTERPKSLIAEIATYRKYVPVLIKAYCKQSEWLKKATMQIDRCTDIEYDRGNRRWTSEEDETLISLVCEGKYNIHMISTMIGRSPAAITSHISVLVGRKRLTQEVAGKFIGTINGESAQGEIVGTVYKR